VVGLLTGDELHDRLSGAARRTATDRFCTDRIIPLYERYYEEVCGRQAGKRLPAKADGPVRNSNPRRNN
jgi:hypothetical protein